MDTEIWEQGIEAWWNRYGCEPISPAKLVEFFNANDLMLDILGDGNTRSQQSKLGRALSGAVDRVFACNLVLQKKRLSHQWGSSTAYVLAPAEGAEEIVFPEPEDPENGPDSEERDAVAEAMPLQYGPPEPLSVVSPESPNHDSPVVAVPKGASEAEVKKILDAYFLGTDGKMDWAKYHRYGWPRIIREE